MNTTISLFLMLSLLVIPTIILPAEVKQKKAASKQESALVRQHRLLLAAKKGNLDEVKTIILSHPEDIDAQLGGNLHNRTPLMMAADRIGYCNEKHYDVIKFLIEKGANKRMKNIWGHTAFDLANFRFFAISNALKEGETRLYSESAYSSHNGIIDLLGQPSRTSKTEAQKKIKKFGKSL